MCSSDLPVPIRYGDLILRVGSGSEGTGRGRGFSPESTPGIGGAEVSAVAGEAWRRCRGSRDIGKARGGAACDGEHEGGSGA